MIRPSSRSRPLVLVIDDDPIMRMLAVDALDAAGFDFAEAEDGASGVTAFDDLWPDLVLLDVVMPQMSGFEVCQALRKCKGGADTPILMMTGLDDVEAIDHAYEAGATDFVTKPINYQLLGRRLTYMLRARRTLDELRRSEKWLANAQRVARLGYWEWHAGSDSVDITPSAAELLGLEPQFQSVTFDRLLNLANEVDRTRLMEVVSEAALHTKPLRTEMQITIGETIRHLSIEAEPSFDEATRSWRHLGAFQDVTERRRSEARIRELASFDAVTGLANRRTFSELVTASLNEVPNGRFALLCPRITNLAEIGRSYGPTATEQVAREIARRLSLGRDRLEHSGRLGSEIYGLLIGPDVDDAKIAATSRALVADLGAHIPFSGGDLWPSIHIGIVRSADDAPDVTTLIRNGMTAAELPPTKPGQQYLYYDASLDHRVRERVTIGSAMRKAIGTDQFSLVYQPKVEIASGRAYGAEALLRWTSPDLGFVGPDRFIPLAESNGLIVPLTEFVLETACAQAERWRHELEHPISMAVNISAVNFAHQSFVAVLRSVLEHTKLPPRFLQLELTESALMTDVDFCVARMKELRDLGVTIALDDFGTGYSSLSYLHRFPIDTLKIDRSFVTRIFSSNDGGPIVSTIMALARALRLEVVAEGVEAQAEVDFLADLGCEHIQGYFYSKPLTPAAFGEWVGQRSRLASVGSAVASAR